MNFVKKNIKNIINPKTIICCMSCLRIGLVIWRKKKKYDALLYCDLIGVLMYEMYRREYSKKTK